MVPLDAPTAKRQLQRVHKSSAQDNPQTQKTFVTDTRKVQMQSPKKKKHKTGSNRFLLGYKTTTIARFVEMLPAANAVASAQKPLIACHELPVGFSGTRVSFLDGTLTFETVVDGKVTKRYQVELPSSASDLVAGLDPTSLSDQFRSIAPAAGRVIPGLSDATVTVHTGGTFTSPSTDVRFVSAGLRKLDGSSSNCYFDMVVVANRSHVNYSSRKCTFLEHSGDVMLSGYTYLLHHVKCLQGFTGKGRVVMVGYQKKPLFDWNGKVAFFGVLIEQAFHFVAMDFSAAAVGTNTAIVALDFEVNDDGSVTFRVPVSPTTAVKDTTDAHVLCSPDDRRAPRVLV